MPASPVRPWALRRPFRIQLRSDGDFRPSSDAWPIDSAYRGPDGQSAMCRTTRPRRAVPRRRSDSTIAATIVAMYRIARTMFDQRAAARRRTSGRKTMTLAMAT